MSAVTARAERDLSRRPATGRGWSRVAAPSLAAWVLLAPASAPAAPRLACDASVHDFGAVDNVRVVEHTFVLRNDGDVPLAIRDIEPECGCTTVEAGESLILPGQSLPLAVRLDLTGRKGPQDKPIVVRTDDPAAPEFALRLVGTALAEVEVSPAAVSFADVSRSEAAQRPVRVFTESGPAFRVTGVEAEGVPVAAQVVTLEEGRSYEIQVSTAPPLALGLTRGLLLVATDNPKYPRIALPVTVLVHSDLVAVPDVVVVLDEGGRGAPLTRQVTLRTRSGRPFRVLEARPTVPGVAVALEPSGPAEYRLTISGIPPSALRLDGARIELATDVPGAEAFIVPIKVFPRSRDDQTKENR